MKLRHAFIFAGITLIIAACNFTLAADVTPPPGYVPPTPMPTLGPLFPASAPDTDRGAAIYAEKCSPCHGVTGLGDGEQGKQLPVTVAAFALPETAHKASPASWFTMVSQGNLDRFMPPFTSLSEQERWDVVSYALTLHTTPAMIQKGKSLFEANCSECHADGFTQEFMAGKSAENIAYIISKGQGDMKAITMAEDDMYAVAAYLRTQIFALPATPTPATATEVPVTAEAGTPSTEGTPVEGTQVAITPEAPNVAGIGNVSGLIVNQTSAALPSDLKVTLRGYEHGGDPNAGPQEIVTLESTVNADGTYLFENVEIPEKRIFIAELDLNGITYQSDFAVVDAGATELFLQPITVYTTTEDYSILHVDTLQMYFDFANEQNVQILAVYSISNTTDKTVVVKLGATQEIPFIKMPNNTASVGYEASPDSAPFVSLADGFAMPPSEKPYGLIAFASLPKGKEIKVDQPVVMPVAEVMLLVPEGVTAKGSTLTDAGMHEFQGGNFHMYTSTSVDAGGSVSFTLSGKPKNTTVNPDVTQNQSLLISVGALGLALILAGAWLYWRDRKRGDEDDEEEGEFEDPESLMDAIIALDDLHRAGKLTDEAYKQRRDELKNALKRKS
jgi:mono/diheme cytochrome c family protein